MPSMTDTAPAVQAATLDTLVRHTTARARRRFGSNEDRVTACVTWAWLLWTRAGCPTDENEIRLMAFRGCRRSSIPLPGSVTIGRSAGSDAMDRFSRAALHEHTAARVRRPDAIASDRDAIAFLKAHQVVSAETSHLQRAVWDMTLEGYTLSEIGRALGISNVHAGRLLRRAPALS
jgi:hypothetical protein